MTTFLISSKEFLDTKSQHCTGQAYPGYVVTRKKRQIRSAAVVADYAEEDRIQQWAKGDFTIFVVYLDFLLCHI